MRLGEDDLDRLAGSLADLYSLLYEGRPVEARCTLNGDMLAFAFRDGLSVADEWLLRNGREDRVVEFRRQFFEVVSDEMVAIVVDLVDLAVASSFFDFDPRTRTTVAVFVVEPSMAGDADERRAVQNWGEQVRRNARRLRAEHVANRERHVELQREIREKREEMQRRSGGD